MMQRATNTWRIKTLRKNKQAEVYDYWSAVIMPIHALLSSSHDCSLLDCTTTLYRPGVGLIASNVRQLPHPPLGLLSWFCLLGVPGTLVPGESSLCWSFFLLWGLGDLGGFFLTGVTCWGVACWTSTGCNSSSSLCGTVSNQMIRYIYSAEMF